MDYDLQMHKINEYVSRLSSEYQELVRDIYENINEDNINTALGEMKTTVNNRGVQSLYEGSSSAIWLGLAFGAVGVGSYLYGKYVKSSDNNIMITGLCTFSSFVIVGSGLCMRYNIQF
jgi:hypothetical protein